MLFGKHRKKTLKEQEKAAFPKENAAFLKAIEIA